MKKQELNKAWRDWEKNYPNEFKAFHCFESDLGRRMKKIKDHEISGLLTENGEVDEFELNQYLVNTEEPIPVDEFIKITERR